MHHSAVSRASRSAHSSTPSAGAQTGKDKLRVLIPFHHLKRCMTDGAETETESVCEVFGDEADDFDEGEEEGEEEGEKEIGRAHV